MAAPASTVSNVSRGDDKQQQLVPERRAESMQPATPLQQRNTNPLVNANAINGQGALREYWKSMPFLLWQVLAHQLRRILLLPTMPSSTSNSKGISTDLCSRSTHPQCSKWQQCRHSRQLHKNWPNRRQPLVEAQQSRPQHPFFGVLQLQTVVRWRRVRAVEND